MVIPQTLLKTGKDRSRREDGGKKRGRLCHGCRIQNWASAPVVARPTRESQSCMLSAFLQWGLPALRWGNNTHLGTWPMATGYSSYHRPNHSSEFCIGSCQYPKTWLYRKTNVFQRLSHEQRIKIHHSCSCKLSVVHTRWRRYSLTIDMFKFTDVTASHVYGCVLILQLSIVKIDL